MADLPPGYGFQRAPQKRRADPPSSRARGAGTKKGSRRLERPVPATQGPASGIVQVTPENAAQVQAILLQQIRDWLIRDHRLLREIAYYARCAAENRKPTDAEARAAIDAPPEKLP